MYNQIALITILTDNVPRLAAFYRKVLRFEVKQDLSSYVEFHNVDRVYAEIVAQGVTPVHAPADMPWKQHTAMFADPNGNIHELFADLPK